MNARITESSELRAQLRELTERTLSPIGRYAHLGLLLAAAGVGALVLALLLTEPGLPVRTRLAFGAILFGAAAWVGYACWVLTHRRPLLLRHRVIAGGLATLFTGAFTATSLLAAVFSGAPAAWLASALGGAMLAIAVLLLRSALRRRRALEARRDELVRQIAGER